MSREEKVAALNKITEEDIEAEPVNILDEPLHGIYIPSGLLVAGLSILYKLSGETKILYVIPIYLIFITVKVLQAKRNSKSVYSDKWNALELVDKTLISKNTAIYKFALNSKLDSLNFPVGHHLAVKIPIEGKEDQVRYYTPISPQHQEGTFDILVKSYGDGEVSKWFATQSYTGMKVEFKGPVGRFGYKPCKEIAMIAGGSGITPMLQVLSKVIVDSSDSSNLTLIYANETENDILLKDELDEIAEKFPNFKVHYVLNKPDEKWDGEKGLVTKEIMEKYLPKCSLDSRLLICGKPEMKKMLLDYAEQLGWPKGDMKSAADDQVFVF